MKRWQFDVLFVVMIVGDLFLLFAHSFGVTIDPTASVPFGSLTTYVLTQRASWTKKSDEVSAADKGPA